MARTYPCHQVYSRIALKRAPDEYNKLSLTQTSHGLNLHSNWLFGAHNIELCIVYKDAHISYKSGIYLSMTKLYAEGSYHDAVQRVG